MSVWPDHPRAFADAEPVDPDASGAVPVSGRDYSLEPAPAGSAALDDGVPVRLPAIPNSEPAPRRFGWTAAAVCVSVAAHAALAWFVIDRINLPGLEAATEAISVEIIVEAAPDAAPAVSGDAASTGVPLEAVVELADDAPEVDVGEDGETSSGPPAVEPGPALPPPDVATEEPAEEVATAMPDLPPSLAGPPDFDIEASPAPSAPPIALPDLPPQLSGPPLMPPPAAPEILVAEPFRAELAVPPVFAVPPALPEAVGQAPVVIEAPPPDRAVMAMLAEPPRIQIVPPTAPPKSEERPAKAAQTPPKREKTAERATRRPVEKQERQASAREQARASVGKKAPAARNPPPTGGKVGTQAKSAASAGSQSAYAARVAGHVQRFKRYPAEAQRARTKGAVKVSVTIDRAGGLAGARVSASSGSSVLDREALATARRAAPYPKPPEGVGGRTLGLSFTLRFSG